MSRVLAPLMFGLIGVAILISLGVWQMQRLTWKQAILSDIDNRILAAPVALPRSIDPASDKYLPVTVTGILTGDNLRVLASRKHIGAGYRIISTLETDDRRRVMVDRGFVPVQSDWRDAESSKVEVTGNLHWPDELNSSTPEPDIVDNIWFARDVPTMSAALKTEPVLIIARNMTVTDPDLTPLPVDSAGIPNDHLQYAITWFSLALVWLVMTAYYLFSRRVTAKET